MSDSFNDEMKEIIDSFLLETEELLATLDGDLIVLEQNPQDIDIINAVFRVFHTIKGSAAFLGFEQMVEVAHCAENVLDLLRTGDIVVSADINDLLLTSSTVISDMLEDSKAGKKEKRDITRIIAELNYLIQHKVVQKGEEKKKEVDKKTKKRKDEEKVKKKKEKKKKKESIGEKDPEEKEKEPEKKGSIDEKEKETTDLGEKKQTILSTENKVQGPAARQGGKIKSFDEQTIRVDTKRLDNVLNLVGELVLSKNQLINLQYKLEGRYPEDDLIEILSSTVAHLNLITTDLQLAVMKTRMQPIKKVFGKFPRMVRDLSREKGKKINLEVLGEETELDKSIIETIGDPLVHIIRNSIDHGIEMPEEREKKGKSSVATITLSTFQEGNNIVIQIADDGAGIDHTKVAKKAIEKGLVTDVEIALLPRKDIINFIFHPGFSTAEKVTDISGRGVGMDVVKTNVNKLGGIAEIDTEIGKGTTLSIRLPITVAILQALMVAVADDIFAVPLSSIIEILKVPLEEVKTINHREVVQVRGSVVPLLSLGEEFDITTVNGKEKDFFYMVVIGFGEKVLGVVVDNLVGQQEVVIKSMGHYLSGIDCFSGASIDGDGKVVLILDIASVFRGLEKESSVFSQAGVG